MDNTILSWRSPPWSGISAPRPASLQWIVDSYVLVFVGLLLTMGALGDRFGRKLALLVGMVIFAIASAGSGAGGQLARAVDRTRAATGSGAALIMPSTLSIITEMSPAA